MVRRAVGLVLGLVAALPAHGQDRPLMFPTRDVAVLYKATSGTVAANPETAAMRLPMAWLAASRTVRMDVPGVGWSVTDHRGPTGFMVIEADRRIMDLPLSAVSRQLGPSATAQFTRDGSARIAGLTCNNWRYRDGADQGDICLTADGVMLRSNGSIQGTSGGVEAIEVTYATQDPARFAVPEGYQRLQPRPPRERRGG